MKEYRNTNPHQKTKTIFHFSISPILLSKHLFLPHNIFSAQVAKKMKKVPPSFCPHTSWKQNLRLCSEIGCSFTYPQSISQVCHFAIHNWAFSAAYRAVRSILFIPLQSPLEKKPCNAQVCGCVRTCHASWQLQHTSIFQTWRVPQCTPWPVSAWSPAEFLCMSSSTYSTCSFHVSEPWRNITCSSKF